MVEPTGRPRDLFETPAARPAISCHQQLPKELLAQAFAETRSRDGLPVPGGDAAETITMGSTGLREHETPDTQAICTRSSRT